MKHKKLQPTPLPRIYLISSGKENSNTGRLVRQLNILSATMPCIEQIREKNLEAKQLLTLALQARII